MEISACTQGDVEVLSLRGKLDLANASKLKEVIKEKLQNNMIKLHLNMREVDFINSSGLGALVSIMKEVRIKKGRMTLSNLAPYVNEIFEITQLSHVFEIFESEEIAIDTYKSTVSA